MLAFDTVIGQANTLLQLKEIPYQMSWLNQPKNFSYANGVLRITAGAKTDMFRDPNVTYNTDNAPKLLFEPDSNFVLSTSIQHTFQNKWDGGAIVLFEDSIHWIKFCFEKDYTGAKRVVSVVTKDISDDCNSAEINSNIVYYKMAKADNVITLYYSLDGKKWFLIRHLQFNNLKKIKIGFLAQSPTGDSCTVAFSDIQYRAIRIKDPYQGE
jgi:regulation of enolase protein 1 (concanavalin A-like superfamily)